jgi:homocysteine S-methyltransferase
MLFPGPGPVLLDGGFATTLESHFHQDLNNSLWSFKVLLEHPELISAVHELFVAEGVQLLTTSSYQGTLQRLEEELSKNDAEKALRKSVQIAKLFKNVLVGGSVGPYGAYLADGSEYSGSYSKKNKEELIDFHRRKVEILVDEKCDVIMFETTPCLVEVEAYVDIVNSLDCLAIISLQCKDTLHLASGELFVDAIKRVAKEARVVAVGVNCVAPSVGLELIQTAKQHIGSFLFFSFLFFLLNFFFSRFNATETHLLSQFGRDLLCRFQNLA